MQTAGKSIKEEIASKKGDMRVVISPHPVQGKPSSAVPYLDLAEALTVPSTTIHNIILRSKRVRKYCSILIINFSLT